MDSRCLFASRLRVVAAFAIALTAGSSVRAQPEWPDERKLDGLVCHADFSLDDQMGLLGEIVRLHHDIVKILELKPSEDPVHIYLFAKPSTYRAYVQKWFPSVPRRRALFIKHEGQGMVFAYQSSELATDLRHESTHALLHNCLPDVPLWLDEGLAEYFEVQPHKRVHGNPYLVAVKWNSRLGKAPPLRPLEEIQDMQQLGLREYRQAWSWVHYLLNGSAAGREELIAYLDDIAHEKPSGNLSDRLNRRVQGLESECASHFRGWKR